MQRALTLCVFGDWWGGSGGVAERPLIALLTRQAKWSLHSAGMAQLAVWLALTEQGLGANLQHYAQLAGEGGEVQRYFELPETWKCMAELVFGA